MRSLDRRQTTLCSSTQKYTRLLNRQIDQIQHAGYFTSFYRSMQSINQIINFCGITVIMPRSSSMAPNQNKSQAKLKVQSDRRESNLRGIGRLFPSSHALNLLAFYAPILSPFPPSPCPFPYINTYTHNTHTYRTLERDKDVAYPHCYST